PQEVPEPPRAVPGSPRAVSDAELRELSEQLLAADSNRAGPGQLELNLQGSGSDSAAPRLFSYVSPELLARPTFSRLLALLDNYEPRTGRAEAETAEEQREQRQFLEAALDTPVLALLQRFLLAKGLYPSAEAFRADLHSMWFGLYSRSSGKALDSSGFEHVFHGEGTWGTPGDMWGHGGTLKMGGWTGFPDVLSLQFRWDGHPKPRGSLLVGSSPDPGVTLPSPRRCHVSLGGEAATIQTYSWDKQRLVASAYPLTP
ncbi:ENDUC protein, partial [Orthonyx spaldingii]|nr:ENDUC protein [Orthonyx spaldingii]